MNKIFLLLIFSIFLIPVFQNVYATTYDINMPTGSASPDAPYFWQNEKTGQPNGDIEILIGDSVVWKNGDQAKHTVTSGTIEGGPDGIFGGTDFLVPGESYKFTFTEKGKYPYFCIIHPWMTGTVTVTGGYKLLADVGKNVGDGLTTFNVDYQYEGIISDAMVNEDQKSITFNLVPNSKSLNQNLMMILPDELIEGPFVIFVDGEKNLRFDYLEDDGEKRIEIELPEDVKQMTIVGTKVVPEFGIWSALILGISISSILFLQKSRIIPKF